ncbi:MAG: endonuclease III [Planctomycetes bacterium]|nr:endonuclease III [Planctomycetota bacterium]MCC7169024.1 endonuclease III [Planctomycetota bacterium]
MKAARTRSASASGASTPARVRIPAILERLHREFPDAKCALDHGSPLELLVATVLSAQCTDARVNKVTPDLFAKYKTAADYAAAKPGELEDDIRSTGFFNNKAKSLRGLGAAIRDRFGGEVPRTMDDLLTLPGVARKTANCVLGNAYGIAVGVVVDTHVFRLSHRLGLSAGKNPEKVEDDLIDLVPRSEWIDVSHLLILHGRKTCDARKPKCGACVLEDLCPSAEPAAASVGASARPAQPSRVNLRKGNPKKTETRR